jgi:hypothetical protein
MGSRSAKDDLSFFRIMETIIAFPYLIHSGMLLAGLCIAPVVLANNPVFCNWRAFLDSRLRGNDDSN